MEYAVWEKSYAVSAESLRHPRKISSARDFFVIVIVSRVFDYDYDYDSDSDFLVVARPPYSLLLTAYCLLPVFQQRLKNV